MRNLRGPGTDELQRDLGVQGSTCTGREGTLQVVRSKQSRRVQVSANSVGVVSYAGMPLHAPGRVFTDLAVAIAGSTDAVPTDRQDQFGPFPTARRIRGKSSSSQYSADCSLSVRLGVAALLGLKLWAGRGMRRRDVRYYCGGCGRLGSRGVSCSPGVPGGLRVEGGLFRTLWDRLVHIGLSPLSATVPLRE